MLYFSEDDLIFNLEEDQIPQNGITLQPPQSTRIRQKSPTRNRIQTVKHKHVSFTFWLSRPKSVNFCFP